MTVTKEMILAALADIKLPNDKLLLETDLIDSVEIEKEDFKIRLKKNNFTKQQIISLSDEIKDSISSLDSQLKINISNEENQPKLNIPKQQQYFNNYKQVILIASGKGGVGKSTLALNLAISLKKLGKKVSILDADVYGPSMPLMFGLRGYKPKVIDNKMQPLSKFGIEFISIGNFIEEGDAVSWRGPLVHQAIEQIIRDTNFSGGDYMIIDLPPGTGDVQITLSQLTSVAKAIIVCTAQDVALIDARRAMAMFKSVNIPILGMIENMSLFSCPHCHKEINLFPTGSVKQECKNFKIKHLGKIELNPKIIIGTDTGNPVVLEEESKSTNQFLDIAKNLVKMK